MWVIKLKNKLLSPPQSQLTKSQKLELYLSGIGVLTNVFLIYFAIIILYPFVIALPIMGTNIYEYFLDNVGVNINDGMVYFIFTLLVVIFGFYFSYRKVKKKYDYMQLDNVIQQLHYIAEGHYDYRVPDLPNQELQPIVNSINQLVGSTVRALENQKKFEQTKDELIANVSHDIRTPLTSTIGYLDVVINGQYDTEKQRDHYINVAYTKAKTMKTLVDDLFLYTDSLQTSYNINPIEVPILLYFQQLAADFELQAQEKGINIVINCEPEDLIVCFDVDKMARVFFNLLSNAFKYGRGADRIRLIAYEDLEEQKNIFEVRNNGQVLEAGEEEKIFERSYRTEKSRNAKEPGSGLGLAIVKNMINLHNGEIYALVEDSETVFRIILPKCKDCKVGGKDNDQM